MLSPAKSLLVAGALLGLLVLLLLLTGGASATPDSNNDFGDAVEVHNWDHVADSLSDVDDNRDFYMIYMEADEFLEVTMVMDSGVNFNLYIYLDTELQACSLDNNTLTGEYTEQVDTGTPIAGWYYIEVYSVSGEGDYSLLIKGMANWTFMVYMDADNNLEGYGIDDFLEMSAVGSTPQINIVVQMDRIPGYDNRYDNWAGANRYRVETGMVPDTSSALETLGEVNMGSPDTLLDFLGWGYFGFPAYHYMLVLWDHGGNWYGVCVDDTSSDHLTVPELGTAISDAEEYFDGFFLDVIGFDACQMANVETYAELSGLVSYLVASELNEPGPGWNYEMSLQSLVLDPGMSPLSLASDIADDYVRSYSSPDPAYYLSEVSMTVVNASCIDDILFAPNVTAGEMLVNMSAQHNYYATAWSTSAAFYYDFLDLYDLACQLRTYAPTEQLRRHAWDLINATANATVFYAINDLAGGEEALYAISLTVYFAEPGYYDSSYHALGMKLTETTLWDEMLLGYYEDIAVANDPVEIVSRSPDHDPSTSDPTFDLSVTVQDDDPDLLTYFWIVDGEPQPCNGSGSFQVNTGALAEGEHPVEVWVWDGASWDNASWTLTVLGGTDLLITDYWKEDSSGTLVDEVTSGRPITSFIIVSNDGGSTSGSFNVTCQIDSVPFCYWTVDDLPSGSSVVLETLSIVISGTGMHNISFLLDPEDDVEETNESNNFGDWDIWVVEAQWTVLIYMDGDNNLEPYMIDNFLEMALVGSDAEVSVVVQFDRIAGYDTSYGDWTGCLRFYVEYGMTPTAANALADLGEVNMGDEATLEDFLLWGADTFRAERYMVVLKDHGGAWTGCCVDYSSSHDILNLPEMSYALRSMINVTGAPIDLLLFDDCLMGSMEVAAEFGDLALYAVVSETIGWTSNYDYSLLLSLLQGDPGMSSEAAAVDVIDLMHLVDDEEYITQCAAAYDLQQSGALLSAFEQYLSDLYQCWLTDPGYLEWARLSSLSLDVAYGEDTVDLYQFIGYSMMFCGDDDLDVSGQAVLDMLDGTAASSLVIACRNTPVADFCHGMSAYFPIDMDHFYSPYLHCGAFVDVSEWDDMIYAYLTDAPPLTLVSLEGTEGNDGWYVSPVYVNFIVYDPTSQGVQYLNYTYDGAWTSYAGEFNVSQEGELLLQYHSTGNNDAVEVVRNISLMIDRTEPTVSALVDGYTVTLSASDAISGLYAAYYRMDGGSWTVYTGPFTAGPAGGMYTVEYYAMDVAGNAADMTIVIVGEGDEIDPVSSISISGPSGDNGWYVGAVTVTLSATDQGGSGLEGVYYRMDGGAWTKYVSPLSFPDDGEYVIRYQARDNSGNVEEVRERVLRMDASAPVAVAQPSAPDQGVWYRSPVTVALDATDALSGVAGMYYRLNEGTWTAYSSTLTISLEGVNLLEYYAVDLAGNEGEIGGLEICIDGTAPSVSIGLTGFNDEGWGNGSARCALNASDALSGVAGIFYRLDGGEWSEYSDAFGFNATGTYFLECYAVDTANNSGTMVNATCRIDVTAPESVLTLTGSLDGSVYLNSVTVTLNATDAGSGLGVREIKVGAGEWANATAELFLDVPGTYTLWYRAVDAVGNEEEVRSLDLTVVPAGVPGQVSGLIVVETDGVLQLSWDAPDDGGTAITLYKMYRSMNGGTAVLLEEVTSLSYLDEDVSEGNTYEYHIVAVNLLGEGTASLPVSAELSSPAGSDMSMIIALIVVMAVAAVVVFFMRRK